MHRYQCLTMTFLAGVVSLIPPAAFTQTTTTYNNLSFKGDYVFTETGLAGPGGVLAGIGAITADGSGGITGTMNVRWPGQTFFTAPALGQYQINQDGTGTLALTFAAPTGDEPASMTRRYNLVFTRRGLLGATSDQGIFSTIELEARPAAPVNGYNFASVAGTYGYSETGALNGSATRVAIGDFVLEPSGGVTGTLEERTAGLSPLSYGFTGSYTVNTDGSGTMTIRRTVASGGDDTDVQVFESKYSFLTGKDSKLSAVRLDSGLVSVGVFERQ